MLVIRPVERKDLSALEQAAKEAGPGMTHLPNNSALLQEKIDHSLLSFTSHEPEPRYQEYFFVLEDLQTGQIGGTTAICASAGAREAFYVFALDEMAPLSFGLKRPQEKRLLKLKEYKDGPSELCSLFLSSSLRGMGMGKLLSYSRFLFIASFPERFRPSIIANLRGNLEGDGSTFWEGVGRHFCDLSFSDMAKLRFKHGESEITPMIFPSYPIPVSFLSDEVQKKIGEVYSSSKPAFMMLQEEGFKMIGEIDPYDGGPIIQANTKDIHSIKKSQIAKIQEITATESSQSLGMVSNIRLNFRACHAPIEGLKSGAVAISKSLAEAIEVKRGDMIRYINMDH